MRSQRPIRKDAPKSAARQLLCDVQPQPVVDEYSVNEQHRGVWRIGGAQHVVFDFRVIQRRYGHIRYPLRTATYRHLVWKLRATCMKVKSAGAPPARRTQAERTAATRARLTDSARKLFAERGFNAV